MAHEDLNKLSIDKERFRTARGKGRGPRFYLLLAGAVLLLIFGSWKVLQNRPVEVEVVTVSMIYPSQTVSLLNASGYVVAQRKAAVSSKATGRLEWLGVGEGSVVRKGQLLARLENRDTQATEEQSAAGLVTARAALEQARVEEKDARRALHRYQDLVSQGIIAQADYDSAEARYQRAVAATEGALSGVKGAQAALKGAAAANEYTLIRSPFDGVVLTKNADVGDIVTPMGAAANAKASVITLADMGSLEVEADVAESNLSRVRAGQPCEILLDALPESRFSGVLKTIVPTADRSKGSVMVKVGFRGRDPRVLPEMSAKVAFLERPLRPDENRPKTAIPPGAVTTRDGKTAVYLATGDKAVRTPVTLGGKVGELVEVVRGVKPGDRIVTKPLDRLHDGSRIKIPEK